jgi:two-component system sensor histidine kinase HydH
MWKSYPGWTLPRRTATVLLLVVSLALPLVLVVHSILASRELREMRAIFLRDRAANIAARLELMPAGKVEHGDFEELHESEPALLGLRVFGPEDPDPGNGAVDAIRSGRELYRAEVGPAVFRAYVPFHSGSEVKIAEIELAASAPDFLLAHARHNVLLTAATGAVLLAVALFAIWSMNRAARLERRRLETERLAELGSMAAVLAHEIRNPLGTIKGFAQLARENADGRTAAPLDAIVRESRRLERLVNSLLLYGRPLEPKVRTISWDALAADLAAHAHEAIGGRPVEFVMDAKLATLETDPDLLKQALLNLIRNSVEAIPDGSPGRVSLRITPTDQGGVRIAVEDDGPGLPEKVRARPFAPFTTTKASGTGLGLPISKKLVEALGGTIRLAAVEPHGTRAELEFYGTNSGN